MTNYIDLIDSNGNEWTRTNRFRAAEETIAAQAAVIEKLREALSVVMWFVPNHLTVPENKRRFDILKAAFAIPTDSAKVLAKVRQVERERCAKVCDEIAVTAWPCDSRFGAAIRALK